MRYYCEFPSLPCIFAHGASIQSRLYVPLGPLLATVGLDFSSLLTKCHCSRCTSFAFGITELLLHGAHFILPSCFPFPSCQLAFIPHSLFSFSSFLLLFQQCLLSEIQGKYFLSVETFHSPLPFTFPFPPLRSGCQLVLTFSPPPEMQQVALLIPKTEIFFFKKIFFSFHFDLSVLGCSFSGELSTVTGVVGRLVQKRILYESYEAYNKICDVYQQNPRFCEYQHFSWGLATVNCQNGKAAYCILSM